MLKPVKITCIVLVLVYITYHLVTLSYDPLPGKDETYYANIALNLKNHDAFVPAAVNEAKSLKEYFVHSPVYFVLTGLSFKLFGFGIFQFRVVNLLFGFLLIWIFSNVLKLYYSSTFTALIITTAFLLDPFFQLSLHQGRMDLLSLALILSSAFILLKSLEKKYLKKSDIIISGLMAAVALLTTPRIGFIYLTLAIVFTVWQIKNFSIENILKAALWFLPVIIIWTSWNFYALGGMQEILFNYKKIFKGGGSYFGFFRPTYFIPKQEWFLIIGAIICLLFKLASEEIKLSYFYLFSILSIVVFYIIIIDTESYSILIIPFYYFLIADSLKNLSFNNAKNPYLYQAFILLIFNLSFFSLKGIQTVTTMGQNNYKKADVFIQNYIPSGSKVVGDPLFFYSVKKAGSYFQNFKEYLKNQQGGQIDSEEDNYDYLIVTDHSRINNPETVVLYLSNGKFRKVARFEQGPVDFTKKHSDSGFLPNTETAGYSADLYLRLRFNQPLPTARLTLNVAF